MKRKHQLICLPVAVLLAAGLCACGDSSWNNAYKYDDAKLYTAGGGSVSSTVTEIDIDWIGGDIEIATANDIAELSFSEQTEKTEEAFLMHWRLDGSKLKIKYVKSGTKPENNMKKTLSVEIPASVSLAGMNVDSVSGKVALNNVTAAECDLETVSGDIFLTNVSTPLLDAESVSGKLTVGEGTFGAVNLETVSGDISLENGASPLQSFEAETVSGKVRLQANRCPPSVKIDTTSGNAELIFWEGTGFTLTFDTVSGDFESQFDTAKNGKVYTAAGEGNGTIRIDTTSGDVSVRKILNQS